MGGRPRWGFLVLLLVAMAGCLTQATAPWGEGGVVVTKVGGGEIASAADIDTQVHLGPSYDSTDQSDVTVYGCDTGGALPTNVPPMGHAFTSPVLVEGWLVASQQFTEGVIGDDIEEDAAATGVLMKLEAWDLALADSQQDIGRVSVTKWEQPAGAKVSFGAGQSDFPPGWAVMGLVPANENILGGFSALDWHQPLRLKGYFLAGSASAPSNIHVADDGTCRLRGGAPIDDSSLGPLVWVNFLVTEIGYEDGQVVSLSGEHDDEYALGDVPLIGRMTYLIVLLAVGGGGGAGLYIVAKGMIRREASVAARQMLSREQFSQAHTVGGSMKQARREGRDPSQVGTQESDKARKAREKAARASAGGGAGIKGFSLDAVLNSAGPASGPGAGPGAAMTGSGVIKMFDDAPEEAQSGGWDSAPSGGQSAGWNAGPSGPPGGGPPMQQAPQDDHGDLHDDGLVGGPPGRGPVSIGGPGPGRGPPGDRGPGPGRGPPGAGPPGAGPLGGGPPRGGGPPGGRRAPPADDDFSDFDF